MQLKAIVADLVQAAKLLCSYSSDLDVCKRLEAANFREFTLGEDEFLQFFESDVYNEFSVDTKIKVFLQSLSGSSDITRDLLSRLCSDYCVELDDVVGVTLHNQFDPATQIAIVWSVEDVQGIAVLTDEEAMQVLEAVKNNHDANLGVSWETLQYWIDELYPDAEPYTGE